MFKKSPAFFCTLAVLFLVEFAPVRNAMAADPFFMRNQVSLGNDSYYSPDFGYYYLGFYNSSKVIYKYGYGFLYCFGDDGANGVYFYDFASKDFLYTSQSVYEYPDSPYFYSFVLGSWTYYFENLDDTDLRASFDFSGSVVFSPEN